MSKFNLEIGTSVVFNKHRYKIVKLISLEQVLAERDFDKEILKLPISKLTPWNPNKEESVIDLISDKDWEIANNRLKIIEPLLSGKNKLRIITKLEKEHKIHRSTIYRWLGKYESSYMLSSLVPNKRLGGKGKSRLNSQEEELLNKIIEQSFLTSQKLNVSKLYIEIKLAFEANNLKVPHENTVRNRIKNYSEKDLLKSRYGNQAARDKFAPIRDSYNADHPLSVVQIDHTLLDIILVDPDTRKPIGRPWLTVAIDVYSRVVSGFYLSYDPPSAMSVGLCLAMSILPKEKVLLKHDIDTEWPCWGLMKTVHADNGKDFRSKMLIRACEDYGINIQWRPVRTPHWGGHIERLIGTIVQEIHSLPGTTFSKKEDRKNYNSEKKAVFSLNELEKYLTIFITKIYHNRKHHGTGYSPLFLYKEGILGSSKQSGFGLPIKITDEEKLSRDFMPYFERSVQNYGVKIDKITYYHDVLRRWINSNEPGSKSIKRKFIFRRDPRDISIVYFLDPETEKYFPIPCKNISRPNISIWEFRESIKILKAKGEKSIDEDAIFSAYKELEELKENVHSKSRMIKRKKLTKEGRINIHDSSKDIDLIYDDVELDDIKPFDDIEYDSTK
ncbi:MAG: DDE-type integrase/transposase/recombinase [Cyclobacteriaceae bacterium]|uniref:Mu transposase C-terminal domain-containing protein n=1 Tax=Fulvivirga sp. TaxID=1931237 RepID=UPI0032ECAC86